MKNVVAVLALLGAGSASAATFDISAMVAFSASGVPDTLFSVIEQRPSSSFNPVALGGGPPTLVLAEGAANAGPGAASASGSGRTRIGSVSNVAATASAFFGTLFQNVSLETVLITLSYSFAVDAAITADPGQETAAALVFATLTEVVSATGSFVTEREALALDFRIDGPTLAPGSASQTLSEVLTGGETFDVTLAPFGFIALSWDVRLFGQAFSSGFPAPPPAPIPAPAAGLALATALAALGAAARRRKGA